MWPSLLIVSYCFVVALAALAGGLAPLLFRLTHTRMQLIMSFVGGLVLGVGLLHLLPHSIAATKSVDHSVVAALLGMLVMFFLIRIFHVHQHGPLEKDTEHDHDHDHHHPDECPGTHREYPVEGEHCETHRHRYSWVGLAIGLGLHTMIDGMALAASVTIAAAHGGDEVGLFGLATFAAVLFHKPLDSMSITSVMTAGGWSMKSRITVCLLFALSCGMGAAIFYFGIHNFADQEQTIVGLSLGFAAGVFLCISLADILPEVQFHTHDRGKLSVVLLAGVATAYGIGFLEPAHLHEAPPDQQHHDHAHEDHAHEDHDGHDH